MWSETFIKFFIVYTVGNHLLLKAICSKGFFCWGFPFFFFMSWYHMFSQTKEKNSLKAKAARFILEWSLQNPMNHICRVMIQSDSHSFIVLCANVKVYPFVLHRTVSEKGSSCLGYHLISLLHTPLKLVKHFHCIHQTRVYIPWDYRDTSTKFSNSCETGAGKWITNNL